MGAGRNFDPDFAVFSTLDLGSLEPEETCPLCESNPPMLKYQIGSGRIRRRRLRLLVLCLPALE